MRLIEDTHFIRDCDCLYCRLLSPQATASAGWQNLRLARNTVHPKVNIEAQHKKFISDFPHQENIPLLLCGISSQLGRWSQLQPYNDREDLHIKLSMSSLSNIDLISRLSLNTMTISVPTVNVNTGHGVAISVTGIAQVGPDPR